ncbi:SRPBCC family protein [Parenemella sanctibonifatiensis]|uniref:SnoaL-like domain-containing protein n=1 Tax=Parenemella sanctibonifatiensis TaxID=2016505 RepID=A0A255ED14_9ACTN|nr:SRPBCC family protein [Parenemella sanctibonifatiensis]OYN88811.1 hypothetical protein CGZ92_03655 [Parenemella sanctibonifatiensis]
MITSSDVPEVDLPQAVRDWQAAVEDGSAARLGQCLAADAVLHSASTDTYAVTGRQQVQDFFDAAWQVIFPSQVTDILGGGQNWTLVTHGAAGRRQLHEVHLLRLNHEGLVREVSVYGRPLAAMNAASSKIAARSAERDRRPWLARLLRIGSAPAAALGGAEDQIAMLTAPEPVRQAAAEAKANKRTETVSRVIAAPRQAIFDLLADAHRHPDLDGGGSVVGVSQAPERLSDGAEFTMRMKRGPVTYQTPNTVVEFVEGQLIAWRTGSAPLAGQVWMYILSDVDGGTLVTHNYLWGKSGSAPLLAAAGVPQSTRRGMAATLERLAAIVED